MLVHLRRNVRKCTEFCSAVKMKMLFITSLFLTSHYSYWYVYCFEHTHVQKHVQKTTRCLRVAARRGTGWARPRPGSRPQSGSSSPAWPGGRRSRGCADPPCAWAGCRSGLQRGGRQPDTWLNHKRPSACCLSVPGATRARGWGWGCHVTAGTSR